MAKTSGPFQPGARDLAHLADIDKTPCECRGSGHRRTHQMSSAPLSHAPFEIAIRSGGTSFTCFESIGVHPQAHGATGLTPIKSGRFEDFVKAFLFRGPLDRPRRAGDEA